jgi:hypothetical protein
MTAHRRIEAAREEAFALLGTLHRQLQSKERFEAGDRANGDRVTKRLDKVALHTVMFDTALDAAFTLDS